MPYRRLVAFYFFYYAFFGIYTPYFGLYLQSKGYVATQIGLLMSIFQLTRLFAPNIGGWVADSLGRRMPVVRAAAVLTLAGYALVLPAQGLWSMATALAITGFFWAAQQPLTEALTLSHLRDSPGRYGGVRAWGSFGFIVLVLGMGWWLEHASIDVVYWGCLALLLVVAVSAWLLPEAAPARRDPHAGGVLAILCQTEVLGLLAGVMLMTAAHGTLSVFLSIHLAALGYSKAVIGVMWTLGVVAEIGVMMRAEWLLARVPVARILLAAFAVAVLRFVLIGWCAQWPAILVLAQCLHGITFGACHVAAISVVHRCFGEHHQGQGQAFYGSICYGAGGIIGAASAGWMWDAVGPGWSFTCSALFALLGGLVFGASRLLMARRAAAIVPTIV